VNYLKKKKKVNCTAGYYGDKKGERRRNSALWGYYQVT